MSNTQLLLLLLLLLLLAPQSPELLCGTVTNAFGLKKFDCTNELTGSERFCGAIDVYFRWCECTIRLCGRASTDATRVRREAKHVARWICSRAHFTNPLKSRMAS